MPLIAVDEDAWWDLDTNTVRFPMAGGESRVVCAISATALDETCGKPRGPSRTWGNKRLAAFTGIRRRAERAASRLFDDGVSEVEGAILVTNAELRRDSMWA